jgi:hypothetical protein
MKLKYFLHLSLILRHSKANVMLDIKFIRDNDYIILSHAYYVEKCFKKKFEHFYYLPISTPYNSYLVKNYGDDVLQEKYAQMIGSYMP